MRNWKKIDTFCLIPLSSEIFFFFSSLQICFLILKENEIWRRTKVFVNTLKQHYTSIQYLVFFSLFLFLFTPLCIYVCNLEHVHMRPDVNSNQFKISNGFQKSINLDILNPFQKLFRLRGDFTAATFQTMVRF